MTKRILAFCLSVMMIISTLPVQAFATDISTEPTITEEIVETTSPIEETIAEETIPATTAATVPETESTVPATEATVPVTEETVPVTTAPEETVPAETEPEETEAPTLPEETIPEEVEIVITAPAAASGTYGSLSWNYENETLTISGSGEMTEGNYPWAEVSSAAATLVVEEGVSSIGPSAFLGFTALTSITLPGTVKTIGIAAFAGCAQLTQVTIPEGVETIDFVAFQECCSLTTVSLPVSLTAINGHAFRECPINDVHYAGDAAQWSAITIGEYNEALTEATIHFADGTDQESTKPSWKLENGVLTISGTGAMEDYSNAPWYADRSSIHTLVIGEGITYIGANAFKSLTALTSVTLPESLERIGMYAFSGCSALEAIKLPSSLVSIGTGAFSSCSGLSEINIPENVTKIADAAFSECSELSQVFLPAGLESIGDFAFQDCPISQVYFGGSDLQWCNVTIGSGNDALTESDIYYSEVTGSATGKCGDDLTWLLSDGVLSISGTGKMYDYSGDAPWVSTARAIRVVTVESGVTSIGKYAFASCLGLTTVSLPETLETIGEGAFSTCSALTEITIPEGVKSIGSAAFIDCSKLTAITLPASLTEIGMCAFSDPPLATVHYGSTMKDWNAIAIGEENGALLRATHFYADGSITGTWGNNLSWTLVDGKLTITGSGAMKAGSTMPWNAYKNVIHTVIIGSGITSLPANSFGLFPKLSNLSLPGTLVSIGDGAFATCSALKEVTIPEGLETIGDAVFIDCGSLTTVHLPSTLKTIGDFAFRDCPLTDVYYGSTEENWNNVAIGTDNEALTGAVFHFLSGPADFDLFSGKTLSLSVINPDTGKAYTAKQITWTLANEFEPFASIKSNKLTAKNVFETVRVVVEGTITATDKKVVYLVDIHPALTHLLVLDEKGSNISGQTILMDYTDESLTLTADILPETMGKVTWTVSDSKKLVYAEEYKIDGETLTIVNPKGKAGTVTIKATAEAGVKKTVTVKVSFGSYAKTVEIAEPEKTTIRGGETLTLSASITKPDTVTKPGLVWSVSDKNAATVSNGKVTAKNVAHPTAVTVTATSKDGQASSSIDLEIIPKNEDKLVLMEGTRFVTNSTKALNVGDTYQLSAAVITNGEPSPVTVTWSTSKATVATVSDGLITATGAGTAKITATLGKVKVTMTVKVSTLVSDMEITTKDGKNLGQEEGKTIVVVSSGKGVNLVANILTAGANKAVTWEIVDGTAYAKIASSGKFTANKDLTKPVYVTVKATAKDGSNYSETITVKILPLATGVQIFEGGSRVRSNTVYVYDMEANPKLTLSAKVYPAKANQAVELTSSNKKTADFVDGQLVCYKPGTVTITAKALDGSNQKATFKLTIVKKIQDITFNEAQLKQQLRIDEDGAYVIAGGKSVNLATLISIAPADATNKNLSWRVSDNDAGITVAANGTLKAPKVTEPVTVNVWGQAQDDSGKDVSFNVRVYPATTRLVIQQQTENGWEAVTGKTIEVKAGSENAIQLRAVSEPGTSYGVVTWTSSNKDWAEVASDGLVTGNTARKTVTITCTAADGSAKKATVKIKIVE